MLTAGDNLAIHAAPRRGGLAACSAQTLIFLTEQIHPCQGQGFEKGGEKELFGSLVFAVVL